MAENAETTSLEEPKKSNRTLIIAIAILAVLCCCCIIVLAAGWFLGDCLIDPNNPELCPLALTSVSII